MKKNRFLWIRNLPDGCKCSDIRSVLDRFGEVQALRIFKDVDLRHAVLAFSDISSAIRASTAGIKINDTQLKLEYCDSLDVAELLHKLHHNTGQNPNGTNKKPHPLKLSSESEMSIKCNGQFNRSPSASKSVNGRVCLGKPVNHALRPQNSACLSPTWRGVKISNLPSPSKLSDEHLRHSLFKEFRCFGRILSVFLSRAASGSCEATRDAVITFQRSCDAHNAYQALHNSSKTLFTSVIAIEPHLGVEVPVDGSSSLPLTANHISEKTDTAHSASVVPNTHSGPVLPKSRTGLDLNPAASRCPTRTLCIGGLTAGPTGPVTEEQLTAAFRKFGDITDVHLQSSSNSALIQFTEMRGPLRAMNAHSRDPLRLGGRPLFLAYVPSQPSTGLWFSEMPAALATLNDEELFHRLSKLAPIQEITLISRLQPGQTPSTSVNNFQPPHYVAYVRLATVDHASQLLTELRCNDHFEINGQAGSDAPSGLSSRRLIAVDFASSRQTALVNSLRLNASKPGGSSRIRVISLSSINRAKDAKSSDSSSRDPTTALVQTAVCSSPNTDMLMSRSNGIPSTTHLTSVADSHQQPKDRVSRASCGSEFGDPFASVNLGRSSRLRDSSPSSMSTTSSSSLSSESTSSSTSISSSTVSSCTSSGSSTRSKSHRTAKNQSLQSKADRTKPSLVRRTLPLTSTAKPFAPPSKPAVPPNSFTENLTDSTVITTTPTQHVSSPGGATTTISSISSTAHPSASNVLGSTPTGRTQRPINRQCSRHGSTASDQNFEAFRHTTTPSFPTSSADTALPGTARLSPATRHTPLSASSGVSSGCNSSSDSSPFSTTHQYSCPTLNMINGGITNHSKLHEHRSSPVATSHSKSTNIRQCPSSTADAKSRVYCSEASSGLKLHLSANCPTSTSPANLGSPLTVSIKLTSSSRSQSSALRSPLGHSDLFDRNAQRVHGSTPPTPLSAPPFRGLPRERTSSAEAGDVTGGASSHSTDWFSVESPVYESMYDKIKRRTNKEAEKRRQRQLEVLTAKDKKRRRHQQKECSQFRKSPLNVAPYTLPESFGNGHNAKIALNMSSDKLHRSKSEHTKPELGVSKTKRRVKPRLNRSEKEKSFTLNGSPSPWKSSKQYDSSAIDRRLTAAHKTQRETKEVQRNISPLLSPSSADECDSSSPPGTLTRLSLGMRFPVSATYHECVRPSTKLRSKWSTDDESLSRRSSLSCSGSDVSERHVRKTTNWSELLTKMERANGHVSRKKNSDAFSVSETSKPESLSRKCSSAHSKVSEKLNQKDYPDSWPSGNKNRLDGFTLSCITNRVSHKNNSKTVTNMKRESREDHFNYAAGKKRRHDKAQSFADDRKRQRLRLRTELKEHKNRPTYSSSKNRHTSDDALNSDSDIHRFAPNDLPTSVMEAFTSGRWPPTCRRRLISGSVHSITDDSSQPVTRSPSPVPARFLNKSSAKCSIRSSSMCGDSIGHVDDEHDSTFGAFRDCDRFSSSKSTPSTEPMEQDEFVERECYMKFCEDDWHSSIVSTSPHPTTLDFDVDYCPIDKTEQSSTTYQSTSFSSQLLSPLGKLPSPTPEDSDEDDVRLKANEKLYVTVTDQERQNTLKLFPSSFSSPSFHASFEELPVSQHSGVYEASDPCSSCPQNTKLICTPFLQDSKTSESCSQGADVAYKQSEENVSRPPLSSTMHEVPNTCMPALPDADSQLPFERFVATSDPVVTACASSNSSLVVDSDLKSSLPSPANNLAPSSSHTPTTEQNNLLSGSQPQKDSTTPSIDTTLQSAASTMDNSQSSNGVASPSKKPLSTTGESSKSQHTSLLSPTKPPTDTHDITRYVQSVIERVKAEKVEETQQAASALHHSMGAPTNSLINVLQISKLENTVSLNGTPQSATTTKRSSAAQRKPLLVAASKAGHTNNVSKTPIPIAMAHNSVLGSPHTADSSHVECVATTPNHGSTANLVSTVASNMPSIPGVNACTPLAVSLPLNLNRVTRQASQMLQSYSLATTKCIEATATAASPVIQASPVCAVSTVQSIRRRRRSEGKGAKDSTHVSSVCSTQVSTKTVPPATSVANCKPLNVGEEVVEGFAPGVHVASTSLTGRPQSSVDPYEPNFDEESPPGFEHSQLHPHRSTSPVCSSPVAQVSCAVDTRKVSSPLASPVVSSHSTCLVTEASCPTAANSDIPPASESSVSSNNVTDSVDEVIRDVCAGQFDVQSYLNSWRSEAMSKTTGSPNPVTPIPVNPVLTSAGSVSRSTTLTPSLAQPAQPFPLSLASEPVVAAVTIPVSSGTGVNKSSSVGQNGPNNVVNIGTGNALLNTLVAALQLIPGSQVTVTGPAAAAGVVGAMGTGTISATTITLPVTAARQAAANIKAAVLSATGAMTASHAETNQSDLPTSKVSSTQAVSASSASAISEPLSTLKPIAVSASVVMPTAVPSTNSTTTTTASSFDSSAFVGTVKSSQIHQTSGFPLKVPGASQKIPMSVSLDMSKPSIFTEPSPLTQLHSTKDTDCTVTSGTGCRQSAHPFNTRVRSTTAVHPHHVSTAASSALPPVSSNVTTQHNYRSCGRTPSTSSVISHTIQAFADRLGGTVEPAVLMTLAQAAVTSGHVRGNGSETGNRSETDSQILNYLRRLATRLSDSCPGGPVNRQPIGVVSLDSQGQNPLNTSSPPLATPHLSHITQQHQRFPPVTCPLYVNSAGSDAATIPRPDANPPISPSLISPRAFTGHPGPSTTPSAVNHLAWSSLGQAYPLVWQGRLSLKNAETRVALHYIYGNLNLLHGCMRLLVSGGGGQSLVSSSGPLRIVQRMRLEISQLEGVQRKIHEDGASCVCLALPAGNSPVELMQQTQILNDSFIRYMQEKMAAGIINVGVPDIQQTLYVVHIFPPCEFSYAQLNIAAPELHCRVVQANQSHLLVVVTTV